MSKEKYVQMQKSWYDDVAGTWSLDRKDPVVGSYHAHNEFEDYDKYLFPEGLDTSEMLALEYGCGPGRNLIRFDSRFKRIDGVDISHVNIDNAKLNLQEAKIELPNLYSNDGSTIPTEDNLYDVVFSVICLQHICVHEVRYKIMEEIYRVLKPGGHFCFQMGTGDKKANSVDYYENFYEARGTNGEKDVSVTNEEFLKDDLTKIGFSGYTSRIERTGPGDSHGNWIWVQVRK